MWYKKGVSGKFYEQVNEPLGCIKVGNFFVSLTDCQLLKDSAPPTEFLHTVVSNALNTNPSQSTTLHPPLYLFKIQFNPYTW